MTTYAAYALIGLELKFSKSDFLENRSPSCGHRFNIKSNFCPTCGKPVEIEEAAFPGYEGSYEFVEYLEDKLDGGWLICQTTCENDARTFIGYGQKANKDGRPDHASAKIPDIEMIKTRLKELLEPFHLFDETTFGLHCIHYIC